MYCDSIGDDVAVEVGADAEGFITEMRKMSPSPRLRVYMELVKLLKTKVRHSMHVSLHAWRVAWSHIWCSALPVPSISLQFTRFHVRTA